jgi:hypothetical protein
MVLLPKTLDVISSYSQQEQIHLYNKARELKEAYISNDIKALEKFRH